MEADPHLTVPEEDIPGIILIRRSTHAEHFITTSSQPSSQYVL